MVTTVINALIAGILGAIAISVVQSIIEAQDTTGWDAALTAIFDIIPIVVGVVVIVGMFVLLTQIRSGG